MADIELVIKIPKEDWEFIKEADGCRFSWAIIDGVINGTPLPKGHGRLIDADKLPLDDIDDANYGSNYIKIAQTIIEADKGE